jgi:N-acetyl-gamma-glutamyl-phosphate reductase
MADTIRVAVLGASGYAGGELIRLLESHPGVDVTFLGAKGSVGTTLGEAHPHLAASSVGRQVLEPIVARSIAETADLAFCCLPHGESSAIAPALLDSGVRVIDLAGDFRLAAEDYPDWYGFEHPAPDRSDEAVYGLPELFAGRIGGAHLVANPGCYPTSMILGVAPLLAAGLVDDGPIRVDGKTGLSGAGKAPTDATIYNATEESVRPYRVPGHQHTPEMERGLQLATGMSVPVVFVPHLVPTVRGVVTTSYATLAEGVTTESMTDALRDGYADSPFVRVVPAGTMVDSKRTRATNVIELQAVADRRTGTAIVIGALDNLVKGAAGQAIQNMNLAFGLDEAVGLPTVAVYP